MTGSLDAGARVLLVEDDAGVAALTRELLVREGYSVELESNGATAVAKIASEAFDLVVLDVMLPGADGISVCREVRGRCSTPILMFTARDQEVDEIVGLEVGADDYVPKTASPRVMLARVRALLRRRRRTDDVRRAGALRIERTTRRAWLGDAQLELTTAEFDLLWLLAGRPGEIFERDTLFRALRGIDYDGRDRAVDVLVSRVRRRLDGGCVGITTVRGAGYLLAVTGS